MRRALLRRAAETGVAAYNRKDYDALLLRYGRDLEMVVNPQMQALGLAPIYHGHDGLRRYHERWTDEWGDWQMNAQELIDLGDGRVLVLGRVEGRGTESGATTDSDFGFVSEISGGLVRRERFLFSRAEALKAAGLG